MVTAQPLVCYFSISLVCLFSPGAAGMSVILCIMGVCLFVTELLLDKEADMTLSNKEGDTVLHHACRSVSIHNTFIQRFLSFCLYPLLWLVFQTVENAVILILDRIDDPSVITKANNEGETALHLAARDGMVSVTQMLLSKGASVFSVDNKGRYPALSCASNERIADCLELIISQMMQVGGSTPRPSLSNTRNSVDSMGNTVGKFYHNSACFCPSNRNVIITNELRLLFW